MSSYLRLKQSVKDIAITRLTLPVAEQVTLDMCRLQLAPVEHNVAIGIDDGR
jgi:hypothetical protein